jgi:hypothetical protein
MRRYIYTRREKYIENNSNDDTERKIRKRRLQSKERVISIIKKERKRWFVCVLMYVVLFSFDLPFSYKKGEKTSKCLKGFFFHSSDICWCLLVKKVYFLDKIVVKFSFIFFK